MMFLKLFLTEIARDPIMFVVLLVACWAAAFIFVETLKFKRRRCLELKLFAAGVLIVGIIGITSKFVMPSIKTASETTGFLEEFIKE